MHAVIHPGPLGGGQQPDPSSRAPRATDRGGNPASRQAPVTPAELPEPPAEALPARLSRRWPLLPGRGRYPQVAMVPGMLRCGGRRLRFAVSDNPSAHGPDGPGTQPIWAVNIHGYFAGGQMYDRESALLAARMGWRMVNPSPPGFGGSDPLAWNEVSMPRLAEQVATVLNHLGAGPAVLLGHSMGAAVAVQFALDHPADTLGIIYRDGVATPAWRNRHSLLTAALAPFAPDSAPFADLVAALIFDSPDFLIGRLHSTVLSVLPDFRRNIRTMGGTLPVGSMLMNIDLREELRSLVAQNMPVLPVWGCFDRVTNSATAVEVSDVVRAPVQWVPGGHSWMLARPQGQSDVLSHVESGRRFVQSVEDRWRRIASSDRSLRAVG